MRIPPFRLAISAILVASIALVNSSASLAAQTLENTVVVGTVAYNNQPGTSGVFFVTLPTSSSPGGKIQPLLGTLPPELTVKPGKDGGAWSVLRRPSDGTLFVGDAAGPGGWCHVHILQMAGPRVMSFRSVQIGSVPTGPGNYRTVQGLALLPDGRVVVAAGGHFGGGPMASSPMAILNDKPKLPTVTPVKFSVGLAQPAVQGLALSPDGATAYLTVSAWNNFGLYPSLLYAIPIQSKLAVLPLLLNTWPKRYVSKLTVDRNGVIYTTAGDPVSLNPATTTIEEITIVKGRVTAIKSIPVSSNTAAIGPALDRATGKFVFVSAYHSKMANNNSVLIGTRGAKTVALAVLTGPWTGPPTVPPTPGWGMPFSIDILNAFETYGSGTSRANSYAFVDFPNPGGLPEVGNAGFTMTVESTPGQPLASLLVLGSRAISAPVIGIQLLVWPQIVIPMTWNRNRATVGLPIPNNPAFLGVTVFGQSVHVETGGLAASNGLRIDIQ